MYSDEVNVSLVHIGAASENEYDLLSRTHEGKLAPVPNAYSSRTFQPFHICDMQRIQQSRSYVIHDARDGCILQNCSHYVRVEEIVVELCILRQSEQSGRV